MTDASRRGRLVPILVLVLATGCLPYRADAIDGGGNVDATADAGPEDFSSTIVLDDDALAALDPATLTSAATPCRPPMLARVAYAIDGDTIEVESLDGTSSERVRIMSIDTPEIAHAAGEVDECYGPEATTFTRQLVSHLVWLSFDVGCADRYGRTLAYVQALPGPTGSWSRQLVRRGLARVLVVSPNRLLETMLTRDEVLASEESLGLWGACP